MYSTRASTVSSVMHQRVSFPSTVLEVSVHWQVALLLNIIITSLHFAAEVGGERRKVRDLKKKSMHCSFTRDI